MTPLELLATLPHFRALAPVDREALADALDVRDCEAGHVFIREGERGGDLFLLLDGAVTVTRDRGGRSEPLNRLAPGDLFGLVALVDDAPRSATCRAERPCRVGSWNRSVVKLLLHQRAAVARAFQLALAMQLARDFRQLDRRVRERLRTEGSAP